jgi:DNA modification methylase
VVRLLDPYFADDVATVYAGDCLDVLRQLPDNSVDAVVTDPPYGLGNTSPALVAETLTAWIGGDREYIPEGRGFMGRPWDAFVPPVAVWDEALRVLKPGGHALVFAGALTQDLMTLGLRLAGFDVRDVVMWAYGSGFPKSKDVTEAMGRYLAGERPATAAAPEVYRVTGFLRAARDAAGWSNRQIDEIFKTNGMAGHWTSQASQPAVPSVRQWAILKNLLGFGDEMDQLVADLGANERPEDWGGTEGDDAFLETLRKDRNYASSGGWGTALKPAYEPVIVARKNVVGSITSNVNMFGTGAFNIEGCRTGDAVRHNNPAAAGTEHGRQVVGRWPLNVLVDEWQAAELDRQAPGEAPGKFFPTFRYEAKASTEERPVVDGVSHPTVKPLELMRWLCRLVTPPGGVILDPFAGSGSTVEAAVLEHFGVIAVERSPDYLPLIRARLSKPLAQVLDLGALL